MSSACKRGVSDAKADWCSLWRELNPHKAGGRMLAALKVPRLVVGTAARAEMTARAKALKWKNPQQTWREGAFARRWSRRGAARLC